MLVAVSAGHYPAAPGAISGMFVEHHQALLWQALIEKHLVGRGAKVLMVKAGKLGEKIAEINRGKCDLAVEVHFNSDQGRKGTGSETLYCPGNARAGRLATSIQRAIASFCSPNRGAKEGWYRMDRPGHEDYKGDVDGDEVVDAFLQKTNCMALILEPYFIHEGSRIEANADIVCNLIADTICDALNPSVPVGG